MTDQPTPANPQLPGRALKGGGNIRGAFAYGADNPKMLHNVDAPGVEGAAILMEAMGPATLETDGMIGQTFLAKWWIVQPVELVKEGTGELVNALRTVLITPEGQTLAFVSDGIIDSLDVLVSFFGPGPWEPPLALVLKQQSTRGGRRIFRLIPARATDAQEQAAPNRRNKQGKETG